MPLTRDFKETIQDRARRDAAFREALLKEAVDALLSGDVETGKTVLRDYINATVGFDKLATVTKKSPKSLMRMLGPKGNPQARNFFEIVAYLQKKKALFKSAFGVNSYWPRNYWTWEVLAVLRRGVLRSEGEAHDDRSLRCPGAS